MSTIIKAGDNGLAVQQVAFNFDDMTDRANRYLDRVRKEAAALVAKAQQEADAARRRAEEEGRKQGLEAVRQMVDKRLSEQLATLMPALEKVVRDVQDARHGWLTYWEKSAVHVSAEIARRLIRRELSRHPEITLSLVREALELAVGSSHLRIHLHPKDYETLSPAVGSLVKELAGLAQTEIVADPEVTAGGCRVETAFGSIDQQFEAQLARIEEELT
jgi:flagellar assembly protein FliH